MKPCLLLQIALAISLLSVNATQAGHLGDDIIQGDGNIDVLALFDEESGILSIAGNDRDNSILASAAEDGSLLVNDGRVPVYGGTPTLRNTRLILIDGAGGNDVLAAERLPLVAIRGGDGQDLLIWNSGDGELQKTVYGDDLLIWQRNLGGSNEGGAGLDILIGNTGGDRSEDDIIGSMGNDWIVGGTANDGLYDGWGNDLLLADDVMTERK